MKAIQKFKADDGAEFNAEAACLEYDALCAEVAASGAPIVGASRRR